MPHITLPDALPGIRGPMARGGIAAFFCLCNRYVDGLATWAPDDPEFYRARAAVVAEHGYRAATPPPQCAPPSGTLD